METSPARPPHRLEPSGGCPHADNARLPAGAAVALPGGTGGTAVLGYERLRRSLQHPEVAENEGHFATPREGRSAPGRPLPTFATRPGMTTADGADQRRDRVGPYLSLMGEITFEEEDPRWCERVLTVLTPRVSLG